MSEARKKTEQAGKTRPSQSEQPQTRPRRVGRSGRGVESLLSHLRQQHAERERDGDDDRKSPWKD